MSQITKKLRYSVIFYYFRLQSAKEELGSKAEQTGVLQQENLENQEKIEQLAETHKYVYFSTQ